MKEMEKEARKREVKDLLDKLAVVAKDEDVLDIIGDEDKK